MEIARDRPVRPKFLMYVPNSHLTSFHNRSPWLMLPRSFRALGYDSTLVCAQLTTECPDGVELVQTRLVVKTEGTLLKRGLLRSLLEPLLAFREIAARKPAVVIVSPIRSSLVTFLAMVMLYRLVLSRSTRFILKADYSLDDTASDPPISLLSNALFALSSRFLDLISVETSCGVERAQTVPGIAGWKVVRVPIGFPQGLVNSKTYEEVARDPVILCVARIARMKGQDILLKSFATLASRHPTWSVRLVGPIEDPGFHEELLEFIAHESLQGRVSFLGFLGESDVDREYYHASIFCLPSVRSESAGQVKYEATTFGLPVVTTDVPCGRDAVEMGLFVARAGDPIDLASKLDELMLDEATRRRAAEMAQKRQQSYLDVARSILAALR